ncbi:hypothetical protein GCM10010195_25660 [Kitasatospora griseola]|nr:hypothetical protein GCM10010195_25660 [Kitasatospora griseola]
MFVAGQLGQGLRCGGEQIGQVSVAVHPDLVEAVEPAEEPDLTSRQSEAFPDQFDRFGDGRKVDGDCFQSGHAG